MRDREKERTGETSRPAESYRNTNRGKYVKRKREREKARNRQQEKHRKRKREDERQSEMFVCACVCVCERESNREREREREREKQRKRERENGRNRQLEGVMSHLCPPVALLLRCETCPRPHIPLPMFPHRGQCSGFVASMEDCRLAQPERPELRPRPVLDPTSAVALMRVEGAAFPHGPPQELTLSKITVSNKYTAMKEQMPWGCRYTNERACFYTVVPR